MSLPSGKLISPPLEKTIDEALEKFAERLPMRSLIPRDGLPYLYRNFLEGKDTPDGEPGLFLHKFVSSDDSSKVHCHPWTWAVSYILAGSYRETRMRRAPNVFKRKTDKVTLLPPEINSFETGQINFISSDVFHSVEIRSQNVWTLFLHGPREHRWGFLDAISGREQKISYVNTRTKDRDVKGAIRKK